MSTANPPSPPGERAVTAEDVELAERRAAAARENAARAGLSAAQSLEKSAVQHDRVAKIHDLAIEQGAPHTDVHRRSAIAHRQAAAEDRKLAGLKRQESGADLASGTGP